MSGYWWQDPIAMAEHDALRKQFRAEQERFNLECHEAGDRFDELVRQSRKERLEGL